MYDQDAKPLAPGTVSIVGPEDEIAALKSSALGEDDRSMEKDGRRVNPVDVVDMWQGVRGRQYYEWSTKTQKLP